MQHRFADFELDVTTLELRRGAERIPLGAKPLMILRTLLQRPGELVTRAELRNELWPADTFVDFDANLNAAVRRLRAALGDDAEQPRWIETLPGRGYRYIGPVHERSGRRNLRPALIATVLIAAVGALSFAWQSRADKVTLVVKPVTALQGGTGVSATLTEELTSYRPVLISV